MEKDSYWFRHDSTAGRGVKMRKMAFIYGHWGKGVYWDVVEILRDQSEYKFECDTESLRLLADLIGCKDEAKFINWFKDGVGIGLFEITDKFFICPVLSKNMSVWEIKKNNGNQGGRPKKNLIKTESKPNIKPNQNHNRIEQNRTEDKDYLLFLSFLNSALGKNFRGCKKSKIAFVSRIKEGITLKDLECAINNLATDDYHKKFSYNYATPEFILRPDKLDRFLNMNKGQVPQQTITPQTNAAYF